LKVAFIGLGRMGQAMVNRLLDAGHEVVVYNRSVDKLKEVLARGAIHAPSIKSAAAQSDGLVLSMLADDKALNAVADGPDGLIANLPANGVHVAMGTHAVATIRALAARHLQAGQSLVAAPVLGRPEAVTAGKLGIIVAGPGVAAEKARPALESIGRRLFQAGEEPGAALAVKLANNMLLGCAIEAMGEAFALVEKSGAPGALFREVLIDGMFASPAYNAYATIIAEKSYDKVGFTASLALKDASLALAAAETAAVPLPSVSVYRDRLLSAVAHGGAEKDWAIMAHEQAIASGLKG
jgi:3-hydroxyisobutyrate dehydrogenase-like beta-hydroxyacid dehydrogenase